MNEILRKFSDAKIMVVGDVMLDVYNHGDVSRISPEAPVPVVKISKTEYRLGGAGNVAANITSLGGSATLVSVIANDNHGNILCRLLNEQKIKFHVKQNNQGMTTTKSRIVGNHQQIARMDYEELLGDESSWIIPKIKETIHSHDVVILSDYQKGLLTDNVCQQIIELAKQNNVPVIVDPKGSNWEKYQNATWVTPNLKELGDTIGQPINTDAMVEATAKYLMAMHDINHVLVTRSHQGMSLVNKGKCTHFPTVAKEVFDVSGAGDTVISTLALCVASGASEEDSVNLANLAAGIAVGKMGTSRVHHSELLIASGQKIVGRNELLEIVKSLRVNGKSIVFTNGCFDILHKGHMKNFSEAKNLGDILIVAINSDQSVKRLKGNSRPINSEGDRAEFLSHFCSVDFVTIFDEDTPKELLENLCPDVLVKGGDYTVDQVIGSEYAKKTVIIPTVENVSTTRIVEKILGV